MHQRPRERERERAREGKESEQKKCVEIGFIGSNNIKFLRDNSFWRKLRVELYHRLIAFRGKSNVVLNELGVAGPHDLFHGKGSEMFESDHSTGSAVCIDFAELLRSRHGITAESYNAAVDENGSRGRELQAMILKTATTELEKMYPGHVALVRGKEARTSDPKKTQSDALPYPHFDTTYFERSPDLTKYCDEHPGKCINLWINLSPEPTTINSTPLIFQDERQMEPYAGGWLYRLLGINNFVEIMVEATGNVYFDDGSTIPTKVPTSPAFLSQGNWYWVPEMEFGKTILFVTKHTQHMAVPEQTERYPDEPRRLRRNIDVRFIMVPQDSPLLKTNPREEEEHAQAPEDGPQ